MHDDDATFRPRAGQRRTDDQLEEVTHGGVRLDAVEERLPCRRDPEFRDRPVVRGDTVVSRPVPDDAGVQVTPTVGKQLAGLQVDDTVPDDKHVPVAVEVRCTYRDRGVPLSQ